MLSSIIIGHQRLSELEKLVLRNRQIVITQILVSLLIQQLFNLLDFLDCPLSRVILWFVKINDAVESLRSRVSDDVLLLHRCSLHHLGVLEVVVPCLRILALVNQRICTLAVDFNEGSTSVLRSDPILVRFNILCTSWISDGKYIIHTLLLFAISTFNLGLAIELRANPFLSQADLLLHLILLVLNGLEAREDALHVLVIQHMVFLGLLILRLDIFHRLRNYLQVFG